MYKVLIVIGEPEYGITSQVLSYDDWATAEEAIRHLKAESRIICVITRLYDES